MLHSEQEIAIWTWKALERIWELIWILREEKEGFEKIKEIRGIPVGRYKLNKWTQMGILKRKARRSGCLGRSVLVED